MGRSAAAMLALLAALTTGACASGGPTTERNEAARPRVNPPQTEPAVPRVVSRPTGRVLPADRPRGGGGDPTGVFFHGWTGATAGTGWLLCFRDADHYRCADILGNGFDFTLTDAGAITVLQEEPCQGGGGRLEGDRLIVDWRCWDQYFSSIAVRAPFTGTDFPVFHGTPMPGDTSLSGPWTSISMQISPVTGEIMRSREEIVRVVVNDMSLRVIFSDGGYVNGLFESPDRAVFRVRVPRAADPRFRTFPGSAASYDEDVMGIARIHDDKRIELDILRQTRDAVGDQIQYQFRHLLTR